MAENNNEKEKIVWENLENILDQKFNPDSKPEKRLKTGFLHLDHFLGGGLSPGLMILGGTPGLGKSTFSLQIAENIANQGCPVLYFSMEMPADRILAKAISRDLYRNGRQITADRLMGGDEAQRPTQKEWEEIDAIKRSLGVKNLFICTKSLSASEISVHVRAFLDEHPDKKPLVIIDYLQILKPEDFRVLSDKQNIDSSLKYLTSLAHGEGGLPVLLISSLNRGSYKGAMQISAFKETGGIEYSADLLLGLQFQACREKGFDSTAERKKSPREVEISILKNRYGSSGDSVLFNYYAAFDFFEEARPGAAVQPEETAVTEAEESVDAFSRPFKAPQSHDGGDGGIGTREEAACVREAPTALYGGFASTINNTLIAGEIRKGCVENPACQVFGTVCNSYRLSAPLSSLDCCVADAVYSLTFGGQKEMLTVSNLLYVLSGNKRRTLTIQKEQEILECIERLRNTAFDLDCTEEMRARERIREPERWEYHGPFLRLTDPDKDGVFHPDPQSGDMGLLPLYTYGEANRQMILFPSILLDVADRNGSGKKTRRLSNRKEIICLKRFLIRRLEIVRHKDEEAGGSKSDIEARKQLRTISFRQGANIFEELQVDFQDRKKVRQLHEAAERILAYYKKIGYITRVREVRHSPLPNQRVRLSSFKIEGPIQNPECLTDI